MDKYQETELLRMTKDELIEHIFYLYKVNENQWNDLCEWSVASEKIEELRKKHWEPE
jgi:hypothetical protein